MYEKMIHMRKGKVNKVNKINDVNNNNEKYGNRFIKIRIMITCFYVITYNNII